MTRNASFLFLFVLAFCATVRGSEVAKIVFDFETGDLQGWVVTEGHFRQIISGRDVYHNKYPDLPDNKYNKIGKYYLSTVEQGLGLNSDDRMAGVVESPSFTITGPEITFRIGGGGHENAYVALVVRNNNGTNDEDLKTRGRFHEMMFDEKWDVTPYIGKSAFIRVVDRETRSWGHVTLDQVVIAGQIDDRETAKRLTELKTVAIDRFLQETNLAGLRAMVDDLVMTFGECYTRGVELAKKIDLLETKTKQTDFYPTPAVQREAEQLKYEVAVSNPLLAKQPICFVVRDHYRSHYHAIDTLFSSDEYNPEAKCEHKALFSPGGSLELWDPSTGKTTTLLETKDGVIRDPDVYFDAGKILFSMRKNRDEDYKIWEMTIEKDGDTYKCDRLTQLTFAKDVADFDPIYLSDDSIVFSSTREPKYNMCSRDIASNLFRMNADGSNIHQITKNTLFDHNPQQLPDGRILYHRWEYVDRNFGDAHAAWTVNPDGTNQALYWGNNTAVPGAVYNPHQIVGSTLMLCVFGPHHAREAGALAIVDRQLGLDGPKPVLRTWPANYVEQVREGGGFNCDHSEKFVSIRYEDPYALSDKYFLCSRFIDPGGRTGIYLVDIFGNEILLHQESRNCFDPVPLTVRERPKIRPSRRNFDQEDGIVFLADVYEGTHMQGVEPGTIKTLRIVESPEKRYWSPGSWFGQGYTAPGMNWHSLENKRILGMVPLEKDGSASFYVPCDTFFYVQALDENDKMVQTMRSGTILQSGEVVGCVGCHEDRLNTPNMKIANSIAAKKVPKKIQEWYGPVRNFGYLNEVQPVFDRHCVSCHDFGQPAGEKLNLAGDQDLIFNASYVELWRKKYVGGIGAGPAELLPAYAWGSHKSRLVRELENPSIPGHAGIKLSKEEMNRVITWVDLNGIYYPDYACAYPDNLGGRCPLDNTQVARLAQLTGLPFFNQRSFNTYAGPYVSFDRPELSPCLEKLPDKGSPEYREALSIIVEGSKMLASKPRCGMPEFVPNPEDQRRETKYQYRHMVEKLNRDAIRGERKFLEYKNEN